MSDYYQEAQIVLFRALETYDEHRDCAFSTYYITMLRNHFCDQWRGQKGIRELDELTSERLIEGTDGRERQELEGDIVEEINYLRCEFHKFTEILSKEEKLLLYFFQQGYSIEVIGAVCQLSPHTVRKYLKRLKDDFLKIYRG
jgi:RNA polymerase sigma factor (sigma-70 family)